MEIWTKQFQILTDINLVWDFFVEIYDREKGGGVAAPFYEYAVQSTWMDKTYQYLNRLRFDGEKVVGFVFNESPVTDIYFKVRPGYEFLASEMVDYALPDGFHFVNPANADPIKLARCCWYGFEHYKRGKFENWEKPVLSEEWTQHKQYIGCEAAILSPSPHATPQFDIIIADEEGEYACFSGMWWVPENKLAYMEPLCTIPKYRKRGLACAALSRHYHRMKALGATHMTGGGDPFYEKIGYGKGSHWYCYGK